MTSLAQTAEAPPGAPPDAGRAPTDGPCAPDAAPGPAAGAPRGDREAMLAEQMAACHRVVLDCLDRAERAGDAEAARHGELRLAARFMTLFLRQSGALDRHRDHVRRAREAEEKAGRERLGRQVTLAAAQGRGFADGLEASLRRFEQSERERRAAAAQGGQTPIAENPATPPTEDFPWPLGDAALAQTEPDPLPYPAAELAPRALTRQQRRAARRAQEKAARTATAG